jgi:MFS family permease
VPSPLWSMVSMPGFLGRVLLTIGEGQTLGRKRTTAVGQIFAILGAALQASSSNLGQMIAARVISGIGVGQITATVPV